MKALSLKQPFAELILQGRKKIELRKWNTKFRGEFLVHASKRPDEEAMKEFGFSELPLGCIVGKTKLIDVKKYNNKEEHDLDKDLHLASSERGLYGFVLENPERLKPINVNGKLGFWDFDDSLQDKKSWNMSNSIKYEILTLNYLNQEFFDSLREEYGFHVFNDWFRKKCFNKDKAYVQKDENDKINAFLILKDENENDTPSCPEMIKKRRLKIALLKVTDNGHKIGESFIKLSINTAIKANINEIYVTFFIEGKDSLIALLNKFGFHSSEYKIKHVNNAQLESVFIKEIEIK